MKKYSLILIAVIMAVFTGCPNGMKYNPDLSKIKNFSNYSSLGVGIRNSSTSRSVARTASKELDTAALVGLNKYAGLVEELSFETENGGSKTNLDVFNYLDTNSFMFVQFCKAESFTSGSFLQYFGEYDPDRSAVYAISKESGKTYDMGNCPMDCIGYSNDSLFFTCRSSQSEWATDAYDTDYIYKASKENDLLKIEKWCKDSSLGAGKRIVDIYGNIIATSTGKYLTKNRDMRLAYYDNEWFLGYDKRTYSRKQDNDYCAYLDENGDVQDIEYSSGVYTIQKPEFSDKNLLYSDNTDYYYENENGIFLISFEDSSKTRSVKTKIQSVSCEPIRFEHMAFYLNEVNVISRYDFSKGIEETVNIQGFLAETITMTDNGLECSGFLNGVETKFLVNTDTLEYEEVTSLKKRNFSSVVYLTPIN